MRTAYCVNLGCSENALDGALISAYLQSNDWHLVDLPEIADLIVVNSCGFNQGAEENSIRTYQDLRSRKRADARIVFAGCLSAINKQAVRDAGYDDVLVTPRKLHVLDSITNATVPIDSLKSGCVPVQSDRIGVSFAGTHFEAAQRASRMVAAHLQRVPFLRSSRLLLQVLAIPDRNTEFVRISVGCLNSCSFCSIPKAKGSTRSVAPDLVVDRVRDALRRGKRAIALSCDEFASYGQDRGTDIARLMRELTSLDGPLHLTLRNVHPEWMLKYWEGLKPSFRTGKVANLVLPLQSGSDPVLRLMKRNHTAGDARWLLEQIRATSPDVVVRTHFIVGFPGETDDDFAATYRFAKKAPIDSFCVHPYSERRFSPSASLPDKVPAEVTEERARVLGRLDAVTNLQNAYWAIRQTWGRAFGA